MYSKLLINYDDDDGDYDIMWSNDSFFYQLVYFPIVLLYHLYFTIALIPKLVQIKFSSIIDPLSTWFFGF